ncbi:MAG: hypothetical protein AB8B78_11825 [Polaribacter sp.]
MKEEHIKNLIEKYKSGTTSLEEEKVLFESDVILDESIQKISTFIKNNKKKSPDNFNEKLWESFEEKTKKPNRFQIGLWAAAASILLLVSISISNYNEDKLTISEKKALLNEAKSMFAASNKTEEKYDIVFENELVVVYTKSE